MTKIALAKNAVNIVVGMGTTKIVHSVIKNNTRPENITDTVTIGSSSIVLGMMAADVTKAYTNAKIDEMVAWWQTNVKKSN